MAWGRVDIAESEIFGGDVEWKVARPPSQLAHPESCFWPTQGEGHVEGPGGGVSRGLQAGPTPARLSLREATALQGCHLPHGAGELPLAVDPPPSRRAPSPPAPTHPFSSPGRSLWPPQAHDLEEVLMDALVSNKPEFVRLFVDNGANVAAFLTYRRLQQLYLSTTPQGLLFGLLQHKRQGGRLVLAGLATPQAREPPAFSLLEVSRVLKDFLQDACHGLYQAVSGGLGEQGMAAAGG